MTEESDEINQLVIPAIRGKTIIMFKDNDGELPSDGIRGWWQQNPCTHPIPAVELTAKFIPVENSISCSLESLLLDRELNGTALTRAGDATR